MDGDDGDDDDDDDGASIEEGLSARTHTMNYVKAIAHHERIHQIEMMAHAHYCKREKLKRKFILILSFYLFFFLRRFH